MRRAPLLVLLLARCATPPTSAPPAPPEAGRDSFPEGLPSFPDGARLEARLPDLVVDQRRELGPGCADPQPNDSCSAAVVLPTALLGKGFSTVTASTIRTGDVDWFQLPAERQDPCPPIPPDQCFKLSVRVAVPPGRRLRLCARVGDCNAAPTCLDSPTTGAAHDLTATLEHHALCPPLPPYAKTAAFASLTCLDNLSECATYSLAGKLDLCP
jgi:hypothetical protein